MKLILEYLGAVKAMAALVSRRSRTEPGIIYTFTHIKRVSRSGARECWRLLALTFGEETRPAKVLLVDWDLEAPGLIRTLS